MTQERFDLADGQGFLLSAAGGQVAVTPKRKSAGQAEQLVSVLNNREGLPFRVNH
jgi:hypothetical protein